MVDCKYTGPTSTEGVGPCHAGVQSCKVDGSGYDACSGEVLPAAKDDCSNMIDDNCNGVVNDGCKCMPGTSQNCYDGPAGTDGVGICAHGTQACKADGSDWEACTGEVVPATKEDCSNNLDDDCNSKVNDGCPCTPGQSNNCYDGPSGTEGVGICKGGTQTCNANGLGYGPCMGEQTPMTEDCSTAADEDCNGIVIDPAAGCVCAPGTTSTCYTGPAGTSGVGNCRPGSDICSSDGRGYGACTGQVLPAVEDCTKLGDEDCDGFACSETLWAHGYGDANAQTAGSVAVDALGNVYVIGSFQGAMQVGATNLISSGGYDIYVIKLKADGTPIWAKSFGTNQGEIGKSITTDAVGNVYFTGSTSSNPVDFGCGPVFPGLFAVELDPTGACVWSPSCSGTGATGAGIAVDGNGSVVVAGDYSGALTCPTGSVSSVGGSTDIVLTRFVPSQGNGAILVKSFGDSATQHAYGVAVDSTGAFAITGVMMSSTGVSFGLVTHTDPNGMGSSYLARFNSAGTVTFSNAFPNSQANGIAIDGNGNMIMTGYLLGAANFGGTTLTSAGGQDVLVAKFGAAGNHLWSMNFGDSAYQMANGVATDAVGNVVITGSMSGMANFGGGNLMNRGLADVFVAKLTASGAYDWSRSYGGTGSENGAAVALGPAGIVHVVGGFNGAGDYGTGTPIPVAGSTDVFVMKIAP